MRIRSAVTFLVPSQANSVFAPATNFFTGLDANRNLISYDIGSLNVQPAIFQRMEQNSA